SARQRLEALGYSAVHCRQGDGNHGWPEQAPFDAIVVAAAPLRPPQPLLDQLADGGRLVVPLGRPGSFQTLWKYVKQPDGEIEAYDQGGVAFVPLTGGQS
ncbi:MAG: protein-L-isoaspartate O-methyltransferase, partial [Anaerolineales bacterium]